MERARLPRPNGWHLESARGCASRSDKRCIPPKNKNRRRHTITALQLVVSTLLIVYRWAPEICTASAGTELLKENDKGSSQAEEESLEHTNDHQTVVSQEETPAESPNEHQSVEGPGEPNEAERADRSSAQSGETTGSPQEREAVWQTPPTAFRDVPGDERGSMLATSDSLLATSTTVPASASACSSPGCAAGAENSISPFPPAYETVLLQLYQKGEPPPQIRHWEMYDRDTQAPPERRGEDRGLSAIIRHVRTIKLDRRDKILLGILMFLAFVLIVLGAHAWTLQQ